MSAGQLAAAIASGETTSREVVAAHLRRIDEVNGQINAVVARRDEAALAEADEADRHLAAGRPLGPLHGVPVTIKDCFHVAGLPSTIGLPSLADNRAANDSPLVARWERAGAIVIGKTNVPQLMLVHETNNPLFGRTNHPGNLDRTPGGSSGGEAAAIAAYCSPLGLANDTGGSIRVPAHFCGICGIKPTSRRLTRRGEQAALRGMEAVQGVSGPLARTVDDLELALRLLVREQADGYTEAGEVIAPWAEPRAIDPSGLRVGFWQHDGYFTPSPAIVRGVGKAVERLAAAGVELVPFQPPEVAEAMRLFFSLLAADGSRDARRLLAGNRREPAIARLSRMSRIPSWSRGMLAAALRAAGQMQAARLLAATGTVSADGYWQLCRQRSAYAARFWQAAEEARLDAFVCPPYGLPAMRHGDAGELLAAGSYVYLLNLLDMPAGVVPITRVRADEESADRNRRDLVERQAARCERGSAELPIGVQVASWPWREDVVLRLMHVLHGSR